MTLNNDSIIVNSKVWIHKSKLKDNEVLNLVNRLTIYPKVFKQFAKKQEVIELLSEDGDLYGLPRHFGMELFGNKYPIVDLRTNEEGLFTIKRNFELWDVQKDPVAKVLDTLRNGTSNGAILESPTGSGKTTMALYIMSEIAAPTMVIIHDFGLIDQWIDEAKAKLNLEDKDIGIVKQKKCDFKGKKLVFCCTQSLHSRAYSYPPELYSWPTLVIYDEVHRTGAKTFCTWMNLVRSKYRLGLSATLRRADDAENVFLWNIGNIAATGVANKMTPNIYMVTLPKLCPDIKNSKGMWLTPTMISRLAGTITKDKKTVSKPNSFSIRRNIIIGNELLKAINSGRKILVLSNRIPQLEEFERFISRRSNVSIGWYIGESSRDEKRASKEKSLILATYKMAAEGLDLPQLDTVVFATPISDVEQAVGRILRYGKDKKTPYVVDFVDTNKNFIKMSNTRLAFYKSKNYPISWIVKS